MAQGHVKKYGNSFYLQVSEWIRENNLQEGDVVHFEPTAIADGGDITKVRRVSSGQRNESEGISTVSYAFASFGGCYV